MINFWLQDIKIVLTKKVHLGARLDFHAILDF